MNRMDRIFLVHGWGGKPEGGWFPWLKEELEHKGFSVLSVRMPEPSKPEPKAWVKALSAAVEIPRNNCFLVGHSLGCITILRYLETLGEHQEIGGAVLVAGFSEGLGFREISSFFTEPLHWKKVRSHCKSFTAIHSDDDPYVTPKYGEVFRQQLGAKVIMARGMGHFEQKENPLILQAVLDAAK